MSDEIRVEYGPEGVAAVLIDRPEVRNAFGLDTWTQLAEALSTVGAERTVGAVVLGGAGKWFSSGADMRLNRMTGGGVFTPVERLEQAQRAVRALARMRKPVVASVEGYAVGAGWGLVLACDLVVAAVDAFFLAPFVQRGLLPDAGTGWHLQRAIGPALSAEFLLTGERLPVPRAAELGLVNRVVEPGAALAAARELAAGLAAGPTDAMALLKGILRRGPALSLDEYLDEELLGAALTLHGPDPAEGRDAFLEKRPPRFRRP